MRWLLKKLLQWHHHGFPQNQNSENFWANPADEARCFQHGLYRKIHRFLTEYPLILFLPDKHLLHATHQSFLSMDSLDPTETPDFIECSSSVRTFEVNAPTKKKHNETKFLHFEHVQPVNWRSWGSWKQKLRIYSTYACKG